MTMITGSEGDSCMEQLSRCLESICERTQDFTGMYVVEKLQMKLRCRALKFLVRLQRGINTSTARPGFDVLVNLLHLCFRLSLHLPRTSAKHHTAVRAGEARAGSPPAQTKCCGQCKWQRPGRPGQNVRLASPAPLLTLTG